MQQLSHRVDLSRIVKHLIFDFVLIGILFVQIDHLHGRNRIYFHSIKQHYSVHWALLLLRGALLQIIFHFERREYCLLVVNCCIIMPGLFLAVLLCVFQELLLPLVIEGVCLKSIVWVTWVHHFEEGLSNYMHGLTS